MAPTILTEALVNPLPPALQHLLPLNADMRAHLDRVTEHVTHAIDTAGFLPFDRFMNLALYAPGLGYYSAGAAKFGATGDFVTAPEISSLYGVALARQAAQIIDSGCTRIVELGAGTGRMAADLLLELERLNCLPASYEIVEVSADLRQRQAATLQDLGPALAGRVRWVERLPERIEGLILGNEVLDAMPVSLIQTDGSAILEKGVALGADRSTFRWAARPATGELLRAAEVLDLPDGYQTELSLAGPGLIRSLADALVRGAILLIDYGFPVQEYYHPQRSGGTLMCHFRQHAHTDPLCLPGLQDITAHVDFTAIARAGTDAGLDLLGYAPQARFLMNCGILDALARIDPEDVQRYAPACAGVQKLLSPAEMGELFKAIAFGRGIEFPLLGFRSGDRSGLL